jgi:putative CocE/NonD family hydrolase
VEDKLPVVWTHTRYRRAVERNGRINSLANAPRVQKLLKHGYVVAAVDVRGSGASFGTWQGIWTQQESLDAHEITEWLGTQPWSNGKVGMFGGSYLGITQLMCAGKGPRHLKAIFPMVALYDFYPLAYHGGIFYNDHIQHWSDLTLMLDTRIVAVPVDNDPGKRQLKQAIKQHLGNRPLIRILSSLPYRDSKDEFTGVQPYYLWHPAAFTKEISQSGVAIYLWCGWLDSFTKDGFLMYANFTNPKKLVMGSWSHSPKDPEIIKELSSLLAVEQLRWFDYWLKGIDNGIMREPPIRYQLTNEPGRRQWYSATQWPLPGQSDGKYYLAAGPSGSVKSVNDGLLATTAPTAPSGVDVYTTDYSTTSGTTSRWDNAVGKGFGYPDMSANDAKGLTYTSQPLVEDLIITGHPVAHLWISSTAPDGDFFAFLEEVDTQGVSHYVSEGCLRASHRAQGQAPYDTLGLPYHRSHEEDLVELYPEEPVELVFDLQPTATLFNAGHRIRLTITCADMDNAKTAKYSPPPAIKLYRQQKHASFILLPQKGDIKSETAAYSVLLIILMVLMVVALVFALSISLGKKIKTPKT